ncbi:TetR/AcrR family transcriptional regulator [Amycolatopsis acidiphila]|uniref:TetR/AcrR family transcriptional regulator n=1 Tax=Amycolatopsis acidiphila TaxID=715473 RepID=A0A558AAL3_9PSEU|nr:TetR/AcrR family transcriptional regulator [Amycolatopsis acidiphila]TVT21309.1 TetR/AcrR family transcriptional regulator [Amycolatopsis acidiphila]UIJ63522.1 TetR/AcrR family transcriptional regulator [Amycolatopsis acidiphila]GHG68468.1 TetR family transcriptional regulator [Amycolatopsis acidiphila]
MATGSERTPSRRERPAKPALTRAGIIAAAVGIMRAEGLQKVTMRRLAQELDTGAASLYVYVANTAELHAAVLDELLGTVDLAPVHARGDWRDRLIAVLTSYTAVLFDHPGLARSAVVARPSGKHYLELIEALLALLDEGGVPRAQAAWGVDVLLQHGTATAAEHSAAGPGTGSAEHSMAEHSGTGPAKHSAANPGTSPGEHDWNALARAVRGPSHPHIAAIGADLLSGTPDERLAWGFRVLVNGIAYTPRTPTSQERS